MDHQKLHVVVLCPNHQGLSPSVISEAYEGGFIYFLAHICVCLLSWAPDALIRANLISIIELKLLTSGQMLYFQVKACPNEPK